MRASCLPAEGKEGERGGGGGARCGSELKYQDSQEEW
jgi:hypothetical protein